MRVLRFSASIDKFHKFSIGDKGLVFAGLQQPDPAINCWWSVSPIAYSLNASTITLSREHKHTHKTNKQKHTYKHTYEHTDKTEQKQTYKHIHRTSQQNNPNNSTKSKTTNHKIIFQNPSIVSNNIFSKTDVLVRMMLYCLFLFHFSL